MKKDPKILIEHVLECIERIEEYVEGTTKDKFFSSGQLQDAVIRRIEIIGEAVKNISEKVKTKYPKIEWKKIAGTRDTIIHAYFSVDLDIVWNIIKKDLPKLKRQMEKIKEEIE